MATLPAQPDSRTVDRSLADLPSARSADREIAAVATRQHGVITRAQLHEAGMTSDRVDRRIRAGLLRVVQRGVYAVGPVGGVHAREMAATLACGERAVVSHRSAAALWQLLPPCPGSDTDVTVHPSRRCRRPGVSLHRIPLRQDEVTVLEDVPVTSPPRTLYDLAATTPDRELERALGEALALRLTTRAAIDAILTRYTDRPAVRRLIHLLRDDRPPDRTRSEAEEAFLLLVRRAQLPAPEVNVSVAGYEVDFFWRAERFVVEIDGFAYHSSQQRFERDRRRDAILAAAGMSVSRITWKQIRDEPEALLVRLAQALARMAPP